MHGISAHTHPDGKNNQITKRYNRGINMVMCIFRLSARINCHI